MENNNQDLLCCVRDMFGGCAGTPSSPSLRYMFAAVLAKQDDGCFALKVDIPIPSAIDVDSLLCGGATETVSVKDEALTQVYLAGQKNPIAVCIEGGEPIELGGYEACYNGVPAHIEIIRDEDTGAIDRYVAHYKDGSGTVVDPADATLIGVCPDPVKNVLPVCDVLTAVVGGTIPYTFAIPYNAAIDYSTVTLTNDTVLFYWTDFGTGYSDVGPAPDHTYEADGHYEIKSYAVTASGNKILVAAKEVDVVAGVVTVTGPNPHVPSRTYQVSVGSAMQEYSGTTPVGTPINPDGSAYTVQGTLAWSCPVVIDELEDNAEWNPENVADLVECVVGSANLVTEALDVNLGAIKEVVSPGSTLTTFHTLLGNNLDIQGDGLTNLMGAGINANISGSTYIGAQFTYTFNLIGEDDPGDLGDFGITVWDNVAGTSVTATSITSTATYAGDAQGSGLNVPLYAWGAPGTYTIVWTGDLPVGDYTIGYINQNFSPADHVELSVTHNIVAGGITTTKAQLVALDQCTIDALTPVPVVTPVVGLTKTVQRTSGTYTVATNYKSVSVTAFSSDVTIDGAPVPMGFPWGVDSSSNERYTDTVTVTGTDYLITEVR